MAAQKERLQVAVSPDLNQQIKALASRVNWSNSQMAAAILELTLENRQGFAHWLVGRMLAAAHQAIEGAKKMVARKKKGKPKVENEEMEYLQVYLEPAIAEQIRAMAEAQGTTLATLASQFLVYGADESELLIQAVTTRLAKSMAAALKPSEDGPLLNAKRATK